MNNNDLQILLRSYAINLSKQTFNELTFVHKHTHIHIRNIFQYKADPTIHVQWYDLEYQNNTPNRVIGSSVIDYLYVTQNITNICIKVYMRKK